MHKFPTELFDAKYIITISPFESVSIEWKYNEVFNTLVSRNKFKNIKTVHTTTNYDILIYERIKEVDVDEIDMYKEILQDESMKYPNLYRDVINDYEKKLEG